MKAARLLPCLSNPPAYQRANCERPAYLSPAKSGLFLAHIDWWVCMPDPLSPKMGLGMKVTVLPYWLATLLMIHLYFIMPLADLSRVLKRKSISAWPAVEIGRAHV